MKLFAAVRDYGFEGEKVIGIFDTHKKAADCCDNDGTRAPDHFVQPYELNKKITLDE